MPIERKLAAIMFTDIAGYTESMSKSESNTLNLLEKKRSILNPLLKEYKGTFVKEIGDGTLSYFESAVNAATCAVKLQETTYDDKEMNIRVGIHIGDIVFKDGDVFGGGVNVASRLESIAPAGGVCVSKSVYDELSNQDDFDGIELGLQSLKGVGRLVEVFGLKGEKLNEPNPSEYQDNKIDKHSDDEVPSIAIIPFRNKGKEEDSFYAFSISVDLITDCSSAGLIRVESLERIEKIENYDKLDITELATKLLVRYIAQGTLWKMDDMFQLSIELYDTKESKVIWSDRWQEEWDNLPSIKGSISDGLLKALDTKPKVEQKVETTNAEAYEFYLKAEHKYDKRENTDDAEIARGLLKKAIDLDDNLISAKLLLGTTYREMGDNDKVMEIYTYALQQAKELGDKRGIGFSLRNIGIVYAIKRDVETALDYYGRSLAIAEEIGNKKGMAYSLNNIGIVYDYKGDCDKALDYYDGSLVIEEEIGDKYGIEISLNNIGSVYNEKGDYEKALDYYERSLAIAEEIGNKKGMAYRLGNIGNVYYDIGDFKKAEKYFEMTLVNDKEIGIGAADLLWSTTYLCLTYKHLGKEYDVNELHSLIKEAENIEYELNYALYQLLEDTSYLETAYNQVQEKADNLEPDVKAKFLSYPIPKAIVEEWEKVK